MIAKTPRGVAELEVSALVSRYGEMPVLRRASLQVFQGEVVALFGPNGHGKSTLLKTIAGIHPATGGTIRYRGRDISAMASEKIVEMGVAYIPEARNLFPEMTVLENLTLGAYNRRARRELAQTLAFVLALFPRLEERKDQIAATLSGGESRMLAVGRGLMSKASLLLIDEPSIGLSPLMKQTVFDAIGKIRRETGSAILIVEQEVDYPLRLADRIYLLKNGQVVLEKAAGEISKAEIEASYF
ncbi:MAG: ABC transporter ATP-binding protein [Desulfobacteraceae bacterium]|jgi:branched-chain amino acid transport system ATP-binding protein|nr:ABC transporter ATP-binding protein [Desulfobacteraceae bacterium]